jgi:hypothetical protein
MLRLLVVAVAMMVLAPATLPHVAMAGERRKPAAQGPQLSEHPNSRYYRGQGPAVRGFVQRKGGYSYSYSDSILDFRDTSILRERFEQRRQSSPFDSDFFFDSGVTRHNDSPY